MAFKTLVVKLTAVFNFLMEACSLMIYLTQLLSIMFVLMLYSGQTFSSESPDSGKVLHFDHPRSIFKSLEFKYEDELKPLKNDFRILEVSYLSNHYGERWAMVTFENTSSGQRLLKNESIIATFANGAQARSLNLNETIKGKGRLSKSVFFGVHQFPIVRVQVE